MRALLLALCLAALCGSAQPPPSIAEIVQPPPPRSDFGPDFYRDPAPTVAVALPVPAPSRTWWRLRVLTTGYSPHDAVDGAYHATKGPRWRWITADLVTDVREEPYGVAVDPRALPYGVDIVIPGYHRGAAVDADDTGGRLRQSWARGVLHLDLRFRTEASALKWGQKTMTVKVDVTGLSGNQLKRLEHFRVP